MFKIYTFSYFQRNTIFSIICTEIELLLNSLNVCELNDIKKYMFKKNISNSTHIILN